MLSVLQSQFIEKGSKKTENFEQNVVLLLFLFTLDFIFPRGKFGSPHLIKHSSRKSSATHSYQCVQYVPVSRQWCGCQCWGCLTCTQMLMRATAHSGCTDTVREAPSALELHSGREKNHLPHRGLEPVPVLRLVFLSDALSYPALSR